jgi:CMP-N-acetylneuraminate monooxygenase
MKTGIENIIINEKKIYIQRLLKPQVEYFVEIDDLIIGKVKELWVAYDRVCDHNGGTLTIDKNRKTATCPIHKWTLDLEKGKYENSCPKNSYKVNEVGNYLEVERYIYQFSETDCDQLIDTKIEIDFNAHASITISIDNIKLTSDPWFIGSCFATGWWHIYPPSEEAIERLQDSDYIYISHNHPDHLHIPSLVKFVKKHTKIIVPNFKSKSVEKILLKYGYKNLIIIDFLSEFEIQTYEGKFRIVIVKSGDDRDDSSLLVVTKKNKIFLGVDANMPNKWILPRVDLLFTAFAGGASGFPSCIDNFSLSKKIEISEANRLSVLHNHVKKLVSATKPNYVVPYAGYFTESPRDIEVKKINKKNSANELISFVESEFNFIKGINPQLTSHITLHNNKLTTKDSNEFPSYFVDETYIKDEVIKFAGSEIRITDTYLSNLGRTFYNSNFKDNLTVVFLPASDDFNHLVSKGLAIDFSETNRGYQIIECINNSDEFITKLNNPNNNNIEILKVRASSFIGALNKGVPLEDLSIGFQIKMLRVPNVYNFHFWNHFTNIELVKLT